MGVQATWGDGDDQTADAASGRGWSDFGAWADALDPARYRQVVHLWEHGYARDVTSLAAQLAAAVRDRPPADPSVLSTAAGLLALAKRAAGSDYLAVTPGFGPETGEDEFDPEA